VEVVLNVVGNIFGYFHNLKELKMKTWTSYYIFECPWETVSQAAFRKYPNPMTHAVVAIDVLDRSVQEGVLHSHRLLSTQFGLPNWVNNLMGKDKNCYVSEHSKVDPQARTMLLESKNMSLNNYMRVDERLLYSPHPTDANLTLLKQEAVVEIHGIPLTSYLEDMVTRTISANANKGRQAMEWVINKINSEVQELSVKAGKTMDEITTNTMKSMDELTTTTKKSMDELTTTTKKSMDDITKAAQNLKIPKL